MATQCASSSRGWKIRFVAFALLVMAMMPAAARCPKLLMFDGTNFQTQTNAGQADYWGNTVGVQGFFVNRVMPSWQDDVGDDPDSKLWQHLSRFQAVYAKYGVTDNFIKVALYHPVDWNDPQQRGEIVEHFAHAAALARHAGFAGMALDLEPYKPTWVDSGDMANTVQAQGAAIARAMLAAYPGMTLVVIKDGLHQAYPHAPLSQVLSQLDQPPAPARHFWHGGYALSVPFLRGLLSVNWSHVVIATEDTYDGSNIVASVRQTQENYASFMRAGQDGRTDLSVSPGLWPLGHSYADKSARGSPAEFARQLQTAFGAARRYVWIYGYGSAWQTAGDYGTGPVTANFSEYVAAIHAVRASCVAGNSSQQPAATP